jgi:NAD(P)-dependent dehydrogenase (short-subunit alcohol dehydrogenase family)
VITVTAPSTVQLNFDDLQGERRFKALHAFGATKMCNLLFTFELARRLASTGVTANALHPGLIRSGLMREAPPVLRGFLWVAARPPARAADALAYLALSPDVAKTTGTFFKGTRPAAAPAYSQDVEHQKRLWELSARLAGL